MKKTVEMALSHLPDLKLKLDKFNRRGAKLGLEPLTYTVEKQYAKGIYAYGTVTVEGPEPVIPGWQMVAAIDRLEGQSVIMTVPGKQADNRWQVEGVYCEHCHTLRRRLRTYVLKETATGREIQLGSTCVLEFTGADLEGMFSFYFDWLRAFDGEGDGFGGPGVLWMETFLEVTAAVIRTEGWVSRKKAEESGIATSATVERVMYEISKSDSKLRTTAADAELAAATIQWAKETLEPQSDYEHNLKVILGRDTLDTKFAGFAASAIPAYQRYLSDQLKREADKNSQYVGEVGKRQVFENLTVIFEKEFPGQYGVTVLVKFRDGAGNILVWFASGNSNALAVWETADDGKPVSYRSLRAGDVVKAAKATVKGHEEYQGVKQTVLTRLKLA